MFGQYICRWNATFFIICPTAIAYSMWQVIKLVCVCVCVSVHLGALTVVDFHQNLLVQT